MYRYIIINITPIIKVTPFDGMWQETVDPWSTFMCQISFESIYYVTFQG